MLNLLLVLTSTGGGDARATTNNITPLVVDHQRQIKTHKETDPPVPPQRRSDEPTPDDDIDYAEEYYDYIDPEQDYNTNGNQYYNSNEIEPIENEEGEFAKEQLEDLGERTEKEKAVKQPNLEDFNFREPPRIAPKYMLDLYKKFSNNRYTHPTANIVRSFMNINGGM